MKDYKEKLEGFIDDLNRTISNPMLFPNYRGGLYELNITKDLGNLVCALRFVESQGMIVLTHTDLKYSHLSDDEENDFYGKCYWTIFRMIMLGEDAPINSLKDGFGNYINCLSFKTIAHNGLSQLVTNKNNI